MRNREYVTLNCPECDKTFKKGKHHYDFDLKNFKDRLHFCSGDCMSFYKGNTIKFNCKQCNKLSSKTKCDAKKTKNNFCSSSCAATYSNTHKTHGIRRSKLEVYLEERLKYLYPDLNIDFNKKDTINSELDIYIPSMKLAFELNGIFHYEPIFGKDQLNKIENNDARKFQACIDAGIELCIIDTSGQKYFKESTSQKYLEIICEIINIKDHG